MSKKLLGAVCALILCAAMAVPTLAWLSKQIQATFPDDISGSTEVAYFESGDGSVDNPYIISNRVHLYNLAWLQYLGYFNLNPELNNQRAQSYFQLKNDIDMQGIALPPIGTTEYPFLGHFDGNGCVVANLVTANTSDLLIKRPSLAQFSAVNKLLTEYAKTGTEAGAMIGFFGVIGDYAGAVDAIGATNGYSVSDAAAPETETDGAEHDTNATILYRQAISAFNFALYFYELQNFSGATTVGIAAGYVNAQVKDVAVGNCSLTVNGTATPLDGKSENLSDYTLVGYCTEEYRGVVNVTEVSVYDPTSEESTHVAEGDNGNEQGWGGSMDMQSLHAKLLAILNNNTEQPTYTYRFHRIRDAHGNEEIIDPETSNAFRVSSIDTEYFSCVFTRYSTSQISSQYIYLSGGAKVTETVYTYGEEKTAYLIGNGEAFLNTNTDAAPSVLAGFAEASAAKWFLSGGSSGGYISTDVNGRLWYLNADETASLVLSDTATTNWTFTNGALSCTSGGVTYYLRQLGNEWILDTSLDRYLISDGTNYLAVSGNALTNAAEGAAARWFFSENVAGGYISTFINGTLLYLYENNGVLGVTADAAERDFWRFADNRLSTGDYYLICNTDTGTPVWELYLPSEYLISDGTYYLNTDGSTIFSGVSAASATSWKKEQTAGGVRFCAVIGGTTYYLYRNGTSLAVTESVGDATVWTQTGNTFSDDVYSIVCQNGTWTVQTEQFCIISSGSNYLNVNSDGSGLTSSTSAADATVWTVSGGNSGTISTLIDGTRYYLYLNGTTLTLSTTDSTDWSNRNGKLYASGGWRSYYIRYNNGWTTTTSSTQGSTLTFTDVEKAPVFDLTLTENDGLPALSVPTVRDVLTLTETTAQEILREDRETTLEFDTGNSTYIPLSMDENYVAKPNNTGYITSGTWDETSTQGYPMRSGDIRVSYYARSTLTSTTPRTVTAGTGGTVATVSGDGADLGLVKYADCVGAYETLVADTNIYGLHFMDAKISKDVLVTVPTAHINGEVFTNYQLPADCIDFSLKEKGYINFFAGTYFDGNDCFFSLHQIFRDENQNITDIKEIRMIYGPEDADPAKDYIYYYSDGTWSATLTDADSDNVPDGYKLSFDMSWITNPTGLVNNVAYYFEVPANAGEYALGSVDGGTGAYLMYLDISANAQEVKRVTLTEVMTETVKSYEYANGVTVIEAATDAFTDANHIALSLSTDFTGLLTLTKNGTTVVYTAGSGRTVDCVAGDLTVADSDGNTATPTPAHVRITTTKRVTYIDYNMATQTTVTTVVTYVLVTEDGVDGTPTVSIESDGEEGSATQTTTGNITTVVTTTTSEIDWSAISGTTTAVRYTYDTAGADASVTNAAVYNPADETAGTAATMELTVTSDQNTTLTVETVTDAYTVSINGTAVTTGSTVDVTAAAPATP